MLLLMLLLLLLMGELAKYSESLLPDEQVGDVVDVLLERSWELSELLRLLSEVADVVVAA